jgi:glutathione-independent formaldehyde dehydrogenase
LVYNGPRDVSVPDVADPVIEQPTDALVSITGLGVVGVLPPQEPGGPDELARHGKVPLDWGLLWFKAQRVGTGQTPVKRYNRELCQLIQQGNAKPSFIVSHELPLDEAPDAYRHFDARDDGWTKVVLKPDGTNGHGAH